MKQKVESKIKICHFAFATAGKAVWDVHRHRVAPEIHQALTEYFIHGEGEVVSAHLVGLGTSKDRKVLTKLDLGKKTEEREYDYVVNCTGPNQCKLPLLFVDCPQRCVMLVRLSMPPAAEG